MLDEMNDERKLALVAHVPFARLLEDTDPVAYRCGLNDFQAQCNECSHEFWADDPDEDAVCNTCREEMRAEEKALDAEEEEEEEEEEND